MNKGEIVLLPFPYTNLSGRKDRPALVLIGDEFDITVAFITSRIKWREETDLILAPSTNNGLKTESLVRLSKLATIDKTLVLGILGRLDQNEVIELDRKLVKVLQIKVSE